MAIYGSLGDIDVGAIDKSIADTAVDVFVYDTRKDSDGGAWRKRTQHTSWYNETLNTATRGSRREFPAVAVIVAENNQVTIYDGDDPDMPMWMVFNRSSNSNSTMLGSNIPSPVAVHMLNGILCVCLPSGGWGVSEIRFLSDSQRWMWGGYPYPDHRQIANSILERNIESVYYGPGAIGGGLINGLANDVAMTVLPNAPIDAATGLPVPTIAVATDSGVSVIKDDGSVVDLYVAVGAYDTVMKLSFTDDNKISYTVDGTDGSRAFRVDSIPSSDFAVTSNQLSKGNGEEFYVSADYGFSTGDLAFSKKPSEQINDLVKRNVAHTTGLSLIEKEDGGPRHAFVTSSFNTGWMHGDIKGAFLSDTDDTNVTGTELVTNGTFDSNTSGWTAANSATVTLSSNRIRVTAGAPGNGLAYQQITTVVGQWYTISYDGFPQTANTTLGQLYIRDGSNSGTIIISSNNPTQTTYSHTFQAISTATFIVLYGSSTNTNGNYAEWDNISLRIAELDRSVNNKGLQVFGTVTKTPVAGSGATAAELVAYSGFSDGDYLKQPHNSSLEFGTGSFSCTVWFKSSTADVSNYKGLVYLNQNGILGEGFQILLDPSNGIYFYIYGPTNDFAGTSHTGYNDGNWHQISVSSTGTQQKVYIDGVLKETGNITTGSITDTSSELFIGKWYGNTSSPFYWRGSIALCRISGSIPSSEQIKKIYEDEKVLFQENAACTLYGSSDAVTALAYDEVNDLLHVGTSSGRSDFNGLRRINNTTTAVTTAISAYDGLIAAQ